MCGSFFTDHLHHNTYSLLDSSFSINHFCFPNFVLLGDFNVNLANRYDFLYDKIEELMDSFVFSQV